jgi:hypothetical protein
MASPHEHLAWDRLIVDLNTWASAVAVAPDRIRVVLTAENSDPREVQVVMSPDGWSDIWGPAYGDFDAACEYVRSVLEDLPSNLGFLVYDCYELHASAAEILPEDSGAARLRELLLQHPDGLQGNWVAYTSDGVAHPFPELPPSG